MHYQARFLRLIAGVGIICAASLGTAQAETTKSRYLSCTGISLQAAAQTGPAWFYSMSGICNLIEHTVTKTLTSVSSRNDVLEAGYANVNARWDPQTGKASESITFDGEFYGTLNASFQCNTNPFETNQSCAVTGYEFSDASLGYVAQHITQMRSPLTTGMVAPEQAAALAQNGTPPPPPPPPPAGTQTIPLIAGILYRDPIMLEAEDLVANISGQGQASAQDMTGFGNGWSNNAQLFWAPDAVGNLMTIPLETSGPSAYSIALSVTRAPDFGQLRAYVRYSVADGYRDTNPVDIDAYAPQVSAPLPVTINVPQTTGDMQLVIITMGKNVASSGLLAGIDSVQLRRAPQ